MLSLHTEKKLNVDEVRGLLYEVAFHAKAHRSKARAKSSRLLSALADSVL